MILPTHFKQAGKKLARNRKREVKRAFKYGKFSPKAIDFIDNCNAPINISHGAVRSSKTINTTIAWLNFIAQSDHEEFLQSGKTRTSLYRNVLRDEMAMLNGMGIDYDHRSGDGYLRIEDKIVWLMGFSNESVTDIVRGMTIGGWYADETNTYPKNAVEEALDRASLENSRTFWTMNPDSPYHYIHTDYITNKTLLNAMDVKAWHYTLYDNPNLPEDYIKRLERRYPKGTVQHKRKILGLWVIAEGIIYDRFVEAHNVFNESPFLNYDYYVISTDYGSGNVTVFGLFGIKRTPEGNHYHLLREFYYDANQNGIQLTDEELIDNALKLIKREAIQTFFTPHDAASLRATLKKRRLPFKLETYTPEVLDDIHEIQSLTSQERFKIHKDCTNSITQAQTYAWDPKSQERGEDKPLKINDHCPDMWRAAIIGSRKRRIYNVWG